MRFFNIVDGPEHHELFAALEFAFDKKVKVTISFTIEASNYDIPATDIEVIEVTAIQHMNKTGKKLRIFGSCQGELKHFNTFLADAIYEFDAEYNTNTHEGKIKLLIQ